MLMSAPEVTALAQTLQPTLPLFNIIEGYQDIQSLVAVLETQQSFALDQNTARFKQNEGPLELPEEHERIKYLGFFLLKDLNLQRELKIELRFSSRFAWTPLTLMLRAFGLQKQRNIRLTQGLSLHQDAEVNAGGLALFEFEALSEWIKYPERVTGFLVYLIRHPGQNAPAAEEIAEQEPGIVRASPGLNVYRRIDTRA